MTGTMAKVTAVAMMTAGLTLAVALPNLAYSDGWYPAPPPVIVVPGGGPSGPGYHPPIPVPPGPGYHPPIPVPPGPGYHPPIPVPPGPGYHPPGYPPVPPYHPGQPGQPPVIVVPGGGPLHTPPAQSGDPLEQDVADLVSASIAGYGCNDIGSALLNLSNKLLGAVTYAQTGNPYEPMPYQTGRPLSREEFLQRWISHLSNPMLMQKVWDRLAGIYQSCDKPCFDDGTAVGQISAAGYCAASIGVGGLDSPGALAQPPLPLCSNSTYVGCIQSYQNAANAYPGCSQYTTDAFDAIFRQSISQDCHMSN